jgi:hypothetical protein
MALIAAQFGLAECAPQPVQGVLARLNKKQSRPCAWKLRKLKTAKEVQHAEPMAEEATRTTHIAGCVFPDASSNEGTRH